MNEPAPESTLPAAPLRSRKALLATAIVAGAVLVAVGVAWSAGMRRGCGDAWIGLAAGRLICERGYSHFPVSDEFTWTFTGQTWYNQNWLWHVLMYLLYDRIFPTALIGLKLLCLLIMAGALILCAWRMCREVLLGAVFAVGGLMLGMSLWDVRPSTGSHTLACLLLLSLVLATYGRAFWGLLVLPILLVWGNAHGSFLFGYVLIGAWVAGEIAERFVHPAWRRMSPAAIGTVLGAAAVSVPLGAWISPYGWANYTHPFVVMGSRTFQRILEWQSPFKLAVPAQAKQSVLELQLPFYIAIGVVVACLLFGLVLHDWAWRRISLAHRKAGDAELSQTGRGMTLSEILVVLLAGYLAVKHLRFVLTFYTLTAPVLCKFVTLRIREAALAWNVWRRSGPPLDRRHARMATSLIAGLIVLAMLTLGRERFVIGYVDPEGRPWREGLFLAHVRDAEEPRFFTTFARANHLGGRLFTQWVWGGFVMFHWPEARVFADGRSQALFDEKMYRLYHEIERFHPPADLPQHVRGERLDAQLQHADVPTRLNAEMLLHVPPVDAVTDWVNPLMATGKWVPILWNPVGTLLIRRPDPGGPASSPQVVAAIERLDRLELVWPDDPWGLASRGLAAQHIRTPDYAEAIRCLRLAIDRLPYHRFYLSAFGAFVQSGRLDEGIRFFAEQHERLRRDACGMIEEHRQASLDATARVLAQLQQTKQRTGTKPAGP